MMRNTRRTTYNDLYALFASKGCKLLTTEKEYEEKHMVKQDKFKYIAKCGHEHEIHGSNFTKGSGVNCKECALLFVQQSNKEKREQNVCIKKLKATDVVKLFKESLGETNLIEWKLTADKYAFSNVLIRTTNSSKEQWLRVYIRHTTRDQIILTFNTDIEEDYLIVILTNTEDLWVIPGKQNNQSATKKFITLSKSEGTKYAPYRSTKSNLATTLFKHLKVLKTSYDDGKQIKHFKNHPMKFDEATQIVMQKECELLTTCEEYESSKLNSKSILKLRMSCGHVIECSINCFQRRQHFKCQSCINQIMSSNGYDDELRVPASNKLEHQAFTYIKTSISNNFDVVKSHEGCIVDMVVRPKNITEDKWIGIQIKSRNTEGVSQYTFSKIGKYPNTVILCVALPKLKMWIFNGNQMQGQKCISIGLNKSKYDSCEVSNVDLSKNLFDFYEVLDKTSMADLCGTIVSQSQIKEHSNRMRREKLFPNLKFEYPIVENTKYDVTINNFKVQDKCAKIQSMKYFVVNLLNNYNKSDNDFYWINKPDGSFYIIPEDMLLQPCGQKIRTKIYLSKDYDKYLYNPSNPSDIEKVYQLFSIVESM